MDPAGAPSPPSARTTGGTYGTLVAGTSLLLAVYSPDQNLNRVEGGSTVATRFSPSTKGAIAVVNSNIGLDGYGFDLERRLVNAAGTGPCSPTELVCRWKVIMGTWSQGYVANLQLTGSTPPVTTPSSAQTAIAETTVRGVVVGTGASGIVQ